MWPMPGRRLCSSIGVLFIQNFKCSLDRLVPRQHATCEVLGLGVYFLA